MCFDFECDMNWWMKYSKINTYNKYKETIIIDEIFYTLVHKLFDNSKRNKQNNWINIQYDKFAEMKINREINKNFWGSFKLRWI